MKKYDALIIGSGQAGTPLAVKLAKAGWRTALVEKRWIGGTCVNDGCTPSKALLSSGRRAYLARTAGALGVNLPSPEIDIEKVIARKDAIVSTKRTGAEKWVNSLPNLEVIIGTATFTGEKKVSIVLANGEMEEAEGDFVFINTGATPAIPTLQGLDTVPYLTSTTIMDLKEIPQHLIILGAGYIALEFGQLYRRLGSCVTILEKSADLLHKEDDDVAREIRAILEEDGIVFHTRATITNLSSPTPGKIEIDLTVNGTTQHLSGSHLLVASGRVPNLAALKPEQGNMALTANGFIKTNDQLETSVKGVYALGDVKEGPAFTHISYNDYLIVAQNVLNHANLSIRNRPVPYCMFIDPELGRIGMTEKEARANGRRVKIAKLKMNRVARGIETGETRGLMKAVVDDDTHQILGASILAPGGGEIMSVLQMAMIGNIPYDQIRDMIFAHPTFSESLNNLFMTLDNP
ncbi:mercuric reductase [Chryseolinea sp. Jin1]|uniref:Mercuric reductase n=2 Tax=Chryseolinea lacunae TaxID=2801331 RepID=A0ABS1L115_9BACT|nr:mercuric reductase [Chryseolinea lacunae]